MAEIPFSKIVPEAEKVNAVVTNSAVLHKRVGRHFFFNFWKTIDFSKRVGPACLLAYLFACFVCLPCLLCFDRFQIKEKKFRRAARANAEFFFALRAQNAICFFALREQNA